MKKIIQMTPRDQVAIAVEDIAAGTEVLPDVVAQVNIPQGHKIALRDIQKGQAVRRYGVVLGYALQDIPKGGWINEFVLELPTPPALEEITCGGAQEDLILPAAPLESWEGYEADGQPYAGTRNLLAIHTTVQCVTGVLRVAVERIRKELLPKYPHVDGVVPIYHAYGCGVAIHAPEARIPIRMLQNLIENPNFGGEIMCVALGCEKLTPAQLLGEDRAGAENVIVLQDCRGMQEMVEAILAMAERKLRRLEQRRRKTLPLSRLCIGMQCGGSDAFSGVTANPSAGYAADMLVQAGATVLFSETTEVRDGAHLLGARCVDQTACDKLKQEIAWYDRYLAEGQVDRSANPTPGNKKGGLANIVEKAMGSIAKSGSAPIVEVLAPGERPSRKGMIFAATPASDFVCGPCQLASGITLQVFMTGRGTPYGLAAAPVLKVCSRNALKEQWPDLIDVNAGPIATGDATIEQIGTELFYQIVNIASGRQPSCAERFELQNDICLFNPAPIT